jgi:hypothetical protein
MDDDPATETRAEGSTARSGGADGGRRNGADTSGRPGLGGLLERLGVERNAKVGGVVGVAVAAVVYSVRVFELLGPAPSGAAGPELFLALAFVLAVGTALLVTVALTVAAAYRETRAL